METVRPASDTATRPSASISGRKSDSLGGPDRPIPRREEEGFGSGPSGDSVRAPTNHVFVRRRIPSSILDDLPESLVDPVDRDEGVLRVTKGDDRGGRGVEVHLEPRTETSPVGGRTITLIGSPVHKLERTKLTYFGHCEGDLVRRDLYRTRSDGPDYLAQQQSGGGHQNPASKSILCQQCSGGTVFGLYQTPRLHKKPVQRELPGDCFRKTRPLHPFLPAEKSSATGVSSEYSANEKPREPRFRTIYYDNPQQQRRLERYNQNSYRSSREITVTGFQDFCRTMLTVKNAPVEYNQKDIPLHHVPHAYQADSCQRQNREIYSNTNFVNGHRKNDVKSHSSFANESLQRNKVQAPLQQQEQAKPSPTLRSPKLVKEVLKKMASHPSGQIQPNMESDSDEDDNFVKDHRIPRAKYPDAEAMKIMEEFDKALTVDEKTPEVQKDVSSVPSVTFKLQPANSHSVVNITQDSKILPANKEQESQSDNLIEEIMFSGTEMKRQALNDKVNNISEKEKVINALNVTHTAKEKDKGDFCSGAESPAPPKPPRNYDSLPRGFKPSSNHSSVDVVSADVQLMSNGTLDCAIRPSSASVDSGVYSPQQNYFVVVAIDFGTTYSGYAFSFTRDPENIHMMRKWEGGDPGVVNQKTPTTLLLTPEEKFHSFGYAARDCYHDLDHQEAKKWLYFEKFKMTLHKNENLSRDTCIAAANGKSLPAVIVFAHALRYFKDHALQELSDQSATNIVNEDIRWVVTVPAIWRQPAKQFMRNASYEAGIASADLPEQLMIALEPEAASIFCRRLRMHQLVPSVIVPQRLSLPNIKENSDYNTEPAVIENKGTRYMVVDCGGGTVDITVHEIVDEQGTIRELHKATGGPYGSVGIDMEFEKLLYDIFGADFMEQFKVKRPAAFVDLMVAFEARKRNSSPFKITPLNISLPFSFIDYYKKIKGSSVENTIKKYGNKEIKWSSQGMLRLEPVCMQRLFQPTLDAIKKHIEVVLGHPGVQDIGYLFLVGGFSESQILQKSIRDTFSSYIKVIIPQGVSLAILKGAVLFGLDPTVVNARRSRLTYGVGVLNRFIHGVHPNDKLVVKDGVEYCADVFDKFVISDQSVCVGDMVIREYTPARHGQSCSVIHIYCSERDDVNFITDPRVKRCGTLILDLSDNKYNSIAGRREIQTVMIFGDTELKVSAIDMSTGKCVKAEVDFFNH